jgi:hypothetical protein
MNKVKADQLALFVDMIARMTPHEFDVSDDQIESNVVAMNSLIKQARKLMDYKNASD